MLCQTKETASDGVAILDPAFRESSIEANKLNIAIALLDGYEATNSYEQEYALASELSKLHPDSKRVFHDQETALRGLERYTEANLADEWLRKDPHDLAAMRSKVQTAVAAGNYAQAIEQTKKILSTNAAEVEDYNRLAWLSLFAGKTDGEDLEAATKAVQLSKTNPGALHTLGCVYAELGKTKEAREVLIQAMDALALDKPDDNYWYAFGGIAEQYGEIQSAKSDYKT